MDVSIEEGIDDICSERKGPRSTVNTAQYAQFTTFDKKQISIPLSRFGIRNRKRIRTIVFSKFINPSKKWVYLDNIAFVGGKTTGTECITPADPTKPNWFPVPYPEDFVPQIREPYPQPDWVSGTVPVPRFK
jgi:hypothetical protein